MEYRPKKLMDTGPSNVAPVRVNVGLGNSARKQKQKASVFLFGGGFEADCTTDLSFLNKTKYILSNVKGIGTGRGQKPRKASQDQIDKKTSQTWRVTGQSTPKASLEMESHFASVEELRKAMLLKVFKAGKSPSPPLSCAITSSDIEMPDTDNGDDMMVQLDATVEERPDEPHRMNLDLDPLRVPLKEISNCPYVDNDKVGSSVVATCDSISRAPFKCIDPSLWPRKKNTVDEGSPQRHGIPLADEVGPSDHMADDMLFDDGDNNSVPS